MGSGVGAMWSELRRGGVRLIDGAKEGQYDDARMDISHCVSALSLLGLCPGLSFSGDPSVED